MNTHNTHEETKAQSIEEHEELHTLRQLTSAMLKVIEQLNTAARPFVECDEHTREEYAALEDVVTRARRFLAEPASRD